MDDRILARSRPRDADAEVPDDGLTVRPHELVGAVRARLRDLGDDAPATVYVTTAKGRLLGTVEKAALIS